MITLICEHCSASYETWEAWAKKSRRHFCSIACRKAAYASEPQDKKAYFREYYHKNKERKLAQAKARQERNKEAKREYDRLRRLAHRDEILAYDHLRHVAAVGEAKALLWRAKQRAKRDGTPCTITVADIVVPDVCPILGIPLFATIGRKGGTPNSPSLDRIYPALGYVPGNVQVVSSRANTIKGTATPEELVLIAEWARQASRQPENEQG